MLNWTKNKLKSCGRPLLAGDLDQSYNKGPSDWQRSHVVNYASLDLAPADELHPGAVKHVTQNYRTVIVYGIGPCGKTFHAAALGLVLGCEPGVVLDLGGVGCPGALTPGGLHFTQARPGLYEVPDDVLIVSIDAAMGAAIALGKI